MKIQKQLSKRMGNKVYHKYVVVISEELIKKSGLKEGDELEGEPGENFVKLKKIKRT